MREHFAYSRNVANNGPGPGDYRHRYGFDLSGNRRHKRVDTGDDESIEQAIHSRYNDRDGRERRRVPHVPGQSRAVGGLPGDHGHVRG